MAEAFAEAGANMAIDDRKGPPPLNLVEEEGENPVGPKDQKGLFQMAQRRHSMDQIISKLRGADVELGKGKKVPEVCKLIGIVEQTYYRWCQKYGGMQPKIELKIVQKENARLKKMVAEQALDMEIWNQAAKRNW